MRKDSSKQDTDRKSHHSAESHDIDTGDVLMNPDVKFRQFLWPFAVKSLPIIVMRAAPYILNLFCFFFISWYQDTNMTAGYGVSFSCMLAFATVPCSINAECMGVYVTKYMGAREYKFMRLSFFRCLGLQ
jgi:Na+-driven multidrug efflux pump